MNDSPLKSHKDTSQQGRMYPFKVTRLFTFHVIENFFSKKSNSKLKERKNNEKKNKRKRRELYESYIPSNYGWTWGLFITE